MKRIYESLCHPLWLACLICWLMPSGICAQTNRLIVGNAEAEQGTTVSLPVSLNNESPVAGGQFELLLPTGVSVDGVTVNASRSNGHTVQYQQKANGVLSIVFYAVPSATLKGSSGELLNISLTVADDCPGGVHPITVRGDVRFASDALSYIPMAESVAGSLSVIPVYDVTVHAANGGSVTGGGRYAHGSQVILTATPEEGYEFVGWSDGTEANPYIFNVKGNVELTATFTKKVYTITVHTTEGGTVTGSGQYTHGSQVTLTATPEEGYEFAGWSDGTKANPYIFNATGNVELTATFTKKVYTITVHTTEGGTVTGGGQYTHGSQVTLTATPDEGYEFVGWSDGTKANPYIFNATGNVELTATFTKKVYTITVHTTEGGTVTGGGQYTHGSQVTLTATPEEGYEFVGWSDGTKTNPYTFSATGNVELTATFTKKVYTITVHTTEGGTVTGGGQYTHGSQVTLTATPEEGYEFAGWSDGTKANPYIFNATGNVELTATFTKKVYNITVHTTEGGTVTGGGQYTHGSQVTLTATPDEGYEFVGWSDGTEANPYTFSATGNVEITATFTKKVYTITVHTTEGGTVTGGGQYTHGSQVTLTATPEEGYEFVGWSDGTEANPYTFSATGNVELTATFTKKVYTITVHTTEGGTVTGSGQYTHGSQVTLTATPDEGYEFAGWSDGTKANPYIFNATGNVELTATFTKKIYTITVHTTEGGTVTGGGQYTHGSQVTLTATPEEGYEFVGWSDGTEANPYTFSVTENIELTAVFEVLSGISTIKKDEKETPSLQVDLGGRRTTKMQKGIYIMRSADGRIKKVLRK